MNAVELVLQRINEQPEKVALWLPEGTVTFGELGTIAKKTRARMERAGVGPGDTVLLFDTLGPALYGAIIGVASLGAAVALVEPWMPVEKINHVLPFVKPKVFLTNWIGRAWGVRVAAIRAIPQWIRTSEWNGEKASEGPVVQVDAEAPAIITFTSGTTGNPKGMVRTHRYLIDQHRILSSKIAADGPDLCIFANFALSNLASGRTSVIMPPEWREADMAKLDGLPKHLAPETLTCGPGFLLKLMAHGRVPSLKSIHVGGALTDCAIFERAFVKWPDAHWLHLYGSTEVEPVAVADAKESVAKSRARNLFQALYLGNPIQDIASELTPDTVWVTGPHVCPRYLANEEENAKYKRTDEQGRIWHRMGDRIVQGDGGWWYTGREKQPVEEFELEQRLYTLISSSAGFIEKKDDGTYRAFAQREPGRAELIRSTLPEISEVIPVTIQRDRRHRARIDRAASLKNRRWDV